MPAKSTAQYNSWQTEKSREEPACFVTLSTGETVRRTHFSGYYTKRERKTMQNKTEQKQKIKSCFSPFVTSSSASNAILTSSPISWNRAQHIISENKQTVVKRNLLTALQLFWLLARREYRSVQGKTFQSRIEKQKTQSTNSIESGNEPRLHWRRASVLTTGLLLQIHPIRRLSNDKNCSWDYWMYCFTLCYFTL